MTDSAGTPAEPDSSAEDEPRAGTSGGAKAPEPPESDEATDGTGEEDEPNEPNESDAPDDPDTPDDSDEADDSGDDAEDSDEYPSPDDSDDSDDADAGTDDGDGDEAQDASPGSGPHPDSDPDTSDTSDASGESDDEPPNRWRRWLRWTALGASVVLLAGAGTGWWLYRKLDNNITTDTSAAAELERYEKERPVPAVRGAQNILLIGSDTRSGRGNAKYGRDRGTQHSDTTILLHLAADRRSATAMSVPRDLMSDVPSCRTSDGSRSRAQFVQFNWAFEFGGAACTIRTLERMTGIRIDHHMVIDFRGFKKMVDAVDGVEVCLKEPIDDDDAHLKLSAGRHVLRGEQALGFVRARKSLGDGSDTERMERQQQFLGALVNKVQSNGVLLNPTRLYPVLDAATKAITTDAGLDSLKDLYDLARSMRNVPTEKVQFLTVPRQPYAYDTNRDQLVQPEASDLFKRLREDAPLVVSTDGVGATRTGRSPGPTAPSTDEETQESDGSADGGDERPDDPGPSRSPAPTYSGTNAASGLCS